jgi:isoaspartyl peptidase/L-asparaginase-like protein (Ntn-hydrolase superfamily)
MNEKNLVILAHGGAGSQNEFSDGTERACEAGILERLSGKPILESVCKAVGVLEDDSRFNAGVGSAQRVDGSIQMDASCMDSDRRFGSVAVVEGYKNPIKIALAVTEIENRILAGTGAAQFAREKGFEILDPASLTRKNSECSDTVGAVMFDGQSFAAALSTGGTGGSIPGRVGDVPLIGCGLFAGEHGAVAATGHGEAIAMNLTAFRAYQMLENGKKCRDVLGEVIKWFDTSEDIGLLLVTRNDSAAGSNRSMAWSIRT